MRKSSRGVSMNLDRATRHPKRLLQPTSDPGHGDRRPGGTDHHDQRKVQVSFFRDDLLRALDDTQLDRWVALRIPHGERGRRL
jgi:hypothetical protein